MPRSYKRTQPEDEEEHRTIVGGEFCGVLELTVEGD
jgi:hypothetical protein